MHEKYKDNPPLYHKKATLLKLLGHPQRLCILRTLCSEGSATVTDMQTCLDEKQAVVSQHLAKLRKAKLIKAQREGTSMRYSIYDENTKKVLSGIINCIF
ncbi:MAG: helix-turn-helix transcriptional regulator [Tissierellia bacterium]|nr:helix-turn-helix transcriptional regulator [Tissierellia bacterium]